MSQNNPDYDPFNPNHTRSRGTSGDNRTGAPQSSAQFNQRLSRDVDVPDEDVSNDTGQSNAYANAPQYNSAPTSDPYGGQNNYGAQNNYGGQQQYTGQYNQQYPAGGYPQPGTYNDQYAYQQQYPQYPRPTNGLAIAALITGILCMGIVPVILGHLALRQIDERNEEGRGMAIAGLVLGYLILSVYVLAFGFLFLGFMLL